MTKNQTKDYTALSVSCAISNALCILTTLDLAIKQHWLFGIFFAVLSFITLPTFIFGYALTANGDDPEKKSTK